VKARSVIDCVDKMKIQRAIQRLYAMLSAGLADVVNPYGGRREVNELLNPRRRDPSLIRTFS